MAKETSCVVRFDQQRFFQVRRKNHTDSPTSRTKQDRDAPIWFKISADIVEWTRFSKLETTQHGFTPDMLCSFDREIPDLVWTHRFHLSF